MSLVGFAAKNHPQQTGKRGAADGVDDRETPPEIFDPLHAEHRFNLDVAASPANTKTLRFFDLESDGLSSRWGGRVWCNPPYSDIRPRVEKAWQAMLVEGAEVVAMLLPANRTEQRWWQEMVEPHRDGQRQDDVSLSVRFLSGRPRFFRPSGKLGGPRGDRPPFGCCVLTWKASRVTSLKEDVRARYAREFLAGATGNHCGHDWRSSPLFDSATGKCVNPTCLRASGGSSDDEGSLDLRDDWEKLVTENADLRRQLATVARHHVSRAGGPRPEETHRE